MQVQQNQQTTANNSGKLSGLAARLQAKGAAQGAGDGLLILTRATRHQIQLQPARLSEVTETQRITMSILMDLKAMVARRSVGYRTTGEAISL